MPVSGSDVALDGEAVLLVLRDLIVTSYGAFQKLFRSLL